MKNITNNQSVTNSAALTTAQAFRGIKQLSAFTANLENTLRFTRDREPGFWDAVTLPFREKAAVQHINRLAYVELLARNTLSAHIILAYALKESRNTATNYSQLVSCQQIHLDSIGKLLGAMESFEKTFGRSSFGIVDKCHQNFAKDPMNKSREVLKQHLVPRKAKGSLVLEKADNMDSYFCITSGVQVVNDDFLQKKDFVNIHRKPIAAYQMTARVAKQQREMLDIQHHTLNSIGSSKTQEGRQVFKKLSALEFSHQKSIKKTEKLWTQLQKLWKK